MAWLAGTAGTGLAGARIPIRVETESGNILATTVTEPDGRWAVWLDDAPEVVHVNDGRQRLELAVHMGGPATIAGDPARIDVYPGHVGSGYISARHARRLAALRGD